MTRRALFLLPLLAALAARAALAFSTHQVLDWDETYYVSLAVTGARGGGLYPYIYGFGPMAIMGGMGYLAYSYALAVKLFGATIFALRGVSLLASGLGLAGLWLLVRRWYGPAAAWIGTAIVASLRLFMLSNTVRMDAWAFAWVTWALVVFAIAIERPQRRAWTLAAGLVFGLGLEAHIDTIVTAMACGLVFLTRRPRSQLFVYAAGLAAGIAIYACANILPNPASYYVTTVLVRVDATATYANAPTGLFGSFLDPRVLLAKEAVRYRQLWALTPALELTLAGAAFAAALVRRQPSDRIVLPLAAGTLAGAAIVLNNASPLYYIHVLPALLIPIGPLFTHGLSGTAPLRLADMRPAALAAAVLVAWGVCASGGLRTARTIHALRAAEAPPVALVSQVRTTVDRRCRVAGDGPLYVRWFGDYPFFVSLRPTEVKLGMLYYRTADEAAYWDLTRPDAVFSTAPLSAGMTAFVRGHGFRAVAPGLWVNPGGCR